MGEIYSIMEKGSTPFKRWKGEKIFMIYHKCNRGPIYRVLSRFIVGYLDAWNNAIA
jgi:hypothetical protein